MPYYLYLSNNIKSKEWKLNFIIIYLAPGDYHWYHAAANFSTNYWWHIAGHLEPVKPSYIENHKVVFKSNERVSVFGTWPEGYFSMTFVGALNVGSMNLHFDPALTTNGFKFISPPYTID